MQVPQVNRDTEAGKSIKKIDSRLQRQKCQVWRVPRPADEIHIIINQLRSFAGQLVMYEHNTRGEPLNGIGVI